MVVAEPSRKSVDRLMGQLQELKGKPGVSSELIDLRVSLLQVQLELFLKLSALPKPGNSKEEGVCLFISPEHLQLGLHFLDHLEKELLEKKISNEQLKQVVAQAHSDPAALGKLVHRSVSSDSADELSELVPFWGVPEASLLFLGRSLAAPFFVGRKAEQSLDVAHASKSIRCSVCSSLPVAALLVGEAGVRLLCCPLCATQWRSARTTCPFCLSNEGLQTLRLESESGCWIEGCETCGNYLKTFEKRKSDEEEGQGLLLPTCATLHFDLLAEEENLRPALPYTAMR